MSKLLQRLNLLATCVLGGVLASLLVAQIRPGAPAPARARAPLDEKQWPWPETLQVYPSHPGDPVKLVRIVKTGKEIVPGTYRIALMAADQFSGPNPLDDWLRDASFVVRNEASRNIVCVGVSVVFPARHTGVDCPSTTSPSSWCNQQPAWCEGGCPILLQRTLQWGRIPALAATGLEVRLREGRILTSPVLHVGDSLQGSAWPALAPGQEAALSLAGRVDGWIALIDPRMPFPDAINHILRQEGLDEATDTDPCVTRQYSKFGCAFAEVSRFNIGIDIVYFEDGTIWGNYGYGYALPNPDGIFTRVDAHDVPGLVSPASAAN